MYPCTGRSRCALGWADVAAAWGALWQFECSPCARTRANGCPHTRKRARTGANARCWRGGRRGLLFTGKRVKMGVRAFALESFAVRARTPAEGRPHSAPHTTRLGALRSYLAARPQPPSARTRANSSANRRERRANGRERKMLGCWTPWTTIYGQTGENGRPGVRARKFCRSRANTH